MLVKEKVLCVDYSSDSSEIVKIFLNQSGFLVETCDSGETALNLARNSEYSLVVTEYRLPDMSGLDFCREFRKLNPQTPLVFFTASAQAREKEKGLACGAQAYLIKPNDLDRITETVSALIRQDRKELVCY